MVVRDSNRSSVCIYVYVHMCVYTHVYVYIYTCMCVHKTHRKRWIYKNTNLIKKTQVSDLSIY